MIINQQGFIKEFDARRARLDSALANLRGDLFCTYMAQSLAENTMIVQIYWQDLYNLLEVTKSILDMEDRKPETNP